METAGDTDQKTIVVIGATGQQGGAVARALSANHGWRVRAISRDPGSGASRRLANRGIEVVAGSLDDPESLRATFAGAHGVFSVQSADNGAEIETRRGIAVADAALATRVHHFVYASVGGAERRTGVPHFESKWRIEEHIRQLGLPATIVRPAFFMENLARPSMRLVLLALMRSYLERSKPLQMISVDDIGKWIAHAFADPDRSIGQAQEIAGDELTRSAIIAQLKEKGFLARQALPIPRLLLAGLPGDVLKMFEWFDADGYKADITALRAEQPDLMTFRQWLSRLRDIPKQ